MLGYVTEPALSGGPAAACARRTLRSPRPPSAWLAGEPIRCCELLRAMTHRYILHIDRRSVTRITGVASHRGIRNLGRERYHHDVGPGAGRADLADR
jgi:hypothetical protein